MSTRFHNIRREFARTLVVTLVLFATGCQKKLPRGITEEFGFSAVVFVSRPAPCNAGSLSAPDDFRPGGNLLMIDPAAPGGELTDLTGLADGDVQGIDVAPDGETLVASIRTGPHDRFHLYTVDPRAVREGSECFTDDGDLGPACSRVTFGPADDTRPFYLPDGRIGFLRSDPDGPVDFESRGRARILMAVDLEGTGLTRLDMGPGQVFGPGSVRNGWVQLVRSTRRSSEPVFLAFRLDPVGAWGIRPDGPEELTEIPLGPRQEAVTLRDCASLDTESECAEEKGCAWVESGQGHICDSLAKDSSLFAACVAPGGTWQAGTVCQRGQDGTWTNVVASIPPGSGCSPEGRVRDPYPLADGRFLLSYGKVPEGCMNTQDGDQQKFPDFGIAILDPRSGTRLPVYNRPVDADLYPRPLMERSLLDEGVSLPDRPGGCNSGGVSFEGFVGQDRISEGAVRVRVVELLTGSLAPWRMELGGGEVTAVCGGESGASEAPIHADGSFRLRAPAGVPLKLELLDRYGAILAVDPVWRGGSACASRRCGSCHQNDGGTEGFDSSLASADSPAALDGSQQYQRDFDFPRDIQPILDRTCVASGCHDAESASGSYVTLEGNLRGLVLSGEASGRSTVSYQNLMFVDRLRHSSTGKILEEQRAYVTPGRASESRLAQRLGVPCRFDCPDPPGWAPWGLAQGEAHPEDKSVSLDHQDRWTIVEWIDAGAPFCGRGARP